MQIYIYTNIYEKGGIEVQLYAQGQIVRVFSKYQIYPKLNGAVKKSLLNTALKAGN